MGATTPSRTYSSEEVDVFEYHHSRRAYDIARYGTQAEAFDSLFSRTRAPSWRAATAAGEARAQSEVQNERKANVNVRSAKIAVDAVAFIVNPENNVEKLPLTSFADIISGRTTQWNEYVPSDRGKIKVVPDRSGSEHGHHIERLLLHGEPLRPDGVRRRFDTAGIRMP